MIKCKSCGEMNADTNKFCIACGSSLSDATSQAMKDALEQAQKGFEKDSLASIDKSRVTYVCTVCGTVNSIETSKCTKCGKPRPRNEFVNALRRIRQGLAYTTGAEESLVEEKSEQIVEQPTAQEPQSVADNASRVDNVSMYVVGGGQANAVVQPFVIVPFVNPNQAIWQTKADKLYKFQPYTQEEIEQIKRDREEQQKALFEAQRLQETYNEVAIKDDEDVSYSKKTKPVRIVSILMAVVAIVIMVFAFMVNIYQPYFGANLSVFSKVWDGAKSRGIMFYAAGIVECVIGIFKLDSSAGLGYYYTKPTDIIAPIAFIAFLILTLVIIVRSFVRIVTGYAKRRGWFLPLLNLVFFLVGIFGLYIYNYISFGAAFENLKNGLDYFFKNEVGIGMYICLGLAALLFIVSCFCPANAKVIRSKKNK
ncbi:MAG TPA: zinc ribbon domain-containing protein [Clostridia bacterium]|nr:zinc ribbon domain-containing protein [Clostridia bacterium]